MKEDKTRVFNMDCMEFMKDIPDNFYELAVVDPPYGTGASKPSIKPKSVKQKNGSILNTKNNNYTHKNWDDAPADNNYFNELIRVSKNQIIWGVNFYDRIFGKGRVVWDKMNGESDQYGCEIAYVSLNERTDVIRFLWSGMFQGENISKDPRKAIIQQGNKKLNEKRIHPTQKPVKLYEWLLMNYANEGDKILDTHLGSGSSRIAAYNLGYDFTGIELDREYFDASNKRFETHKKQLTLF